MKSLYSSWKSRVEHELVNVKSKRKATILTALRALYNLRANKVNKRSI